MNQEHNPDNLTPEQVGDGWRLLNLDDAIKNGDEVDLSCNGTEWKPVDDTIGKTVSRVNLCAYRRRITSPDARTGTPETDAHELATAQDLSIDDDENVSLAYNFARSLETRLAAALAENAVLRADKERMNKLEQLTVNVRQPMVHGSLDLFWASPTDDEGDEEPSDIRAQLDKLAARAVPKAEGGE